MTAPGRTFQVVAFVSILLVTGPPATGRAAEQDVAPTQVEAAAEPTPGDDEAAEGPRDPFRPFNLDLQPKELRPPKTPLEQYELASLTLVAVIWNVSDPKAMVEDDSGLGYTVGVGTPIGRRGGLVKKIEPDRVVVEEETVDFYGEKKKKEFVLKLKPEGEKRP